MQVLNSVLADLLSRDSVEYFFLVSIGTGWYSTSLPYDITIGGVTYHSADGLMKADPPRLSKTVDREVYRLQFADPAFTLKAMFESGAAGLPVTVRMGFLNPSTTNMVDSTGTTVRVGAAFKNILDTLIVYQGTIDSHSFAQDFESGGVATIECSSPMSDLDMSRPFYTSREGIRQWNANDTAFDQIYDGSKQVVTKWGKK
jgi:hypothetical protein